MASNGVTSKKTQATRASMEKVMINAKMSITGERKAMRVMTRKAFCTLVTSVVRRVTRLAVENLSMLRKLKV